MNTFTTSPNTLRMVIFTVDVVLYCVFNKLQAKSEKKSGIMDFIYYFTLKSIKPSAIYSLMVYIV